VDLATILGIITGISLIVWSIFLGGDARIFLNLPSAMITFGGAIAATLISFQFKEIIGVMSVVRKAFFSHKVYPSSVIDQILLLGKKARREGLLAIEKDVSFLEDPFLRSGMELVVDGTEPELIRNIMETELSYLVERHKKGIQIFNALGAYSPAFGMIGTLIGLIAMLTRLENPSQIGNGMAVAMITTFYGAFAANLIFLPIAGKLKNRSDEEVILKEMIIEGVLSIQLGEHPVTINRKLLNFLAPKHRMMNGEKAA
jgi:chemotaxis protein MotA